MFMDTMFTDYDDTRNFAESVLLAIILNYTPEEMVDVYRNFFGGKYDKPVNKIVIHGITAVYNHEKKCWEKEKKTKTVKQAKQETVEAIPIEWIKDYVLRIWLTNYDSSELKTIERMLNDWREEKENEID